MFCPLQHHIKFILHSIAFLFHLEDGGEGVVIGCVSRYSSNTSDISSVINANEQIRYGKELEHGGIIKPNKGNKQYPSLSY